MSCVPERWLLTGGDGQFGGYVARALAIQRPTAEVVALPGLANRLDASRIDVSNLRQLHEVVDGYRPTHIVHLAGTSSPALAESRPEETALRERVPVEFFTDFARNSGAWLMVPSTDFVWSGDARSQPYSEDDTPRPINSYGAIKLSLEQIVLSANVGMVGRFSLMFGLPLSTRTTTWSRIASSLRNHEVVTACIDEYRSPLSFADAASVVVAMGVTRYTGLMHVAGPESLTAEDMIQRLARFLKVEPALNRVSRVDLTPGVRRPWNVAMEPSRLRRISPDLLPRAMDDQSISEVFSKPSAPRARPSSARYKASSAVFTVVVPAFRGADTIHRSIRSIARQNYRGAVHLVIAVNDGRNDTRDAAEALLRPLRDSGAQCAVVETAAGRHEAFNAAEPLLPDGPRLFLDQDALLSPDAFTALAAQLESGSPIQFAAMTPLVSPFENRIAGAYYSAWRELPYVRQSPATMGAYAVSAEGRRRWAAFPAIHSDDKFVRMHFTPRERVVVKATYEVLAPDNVREIVRARRRYIRGNRELVASGLVPVEEQDVSRYSEILRHVVRRPSKWPAFTAFAVLYGAAVASESWQGDVTTPC